MFNFIIREISERRLMINIQEAWESYSEVTIHDLIWIISACNVADSTKKSTILPQLVTEMKTERSKKEAEQSVNRTKTRPAKPLKIPQEIGTIPLTQKGENAYCENQLK